jgi:hypothetical protein
LYSCIVYAASVLSFTIFAPRLSLHLLLNTYANCPRGIVLFGRPSQQLSEQRRYFLPLFGSATIADP